MRRQFEFFGFQRVNREIIAMRAVPLGRTGTAIAGDAEVGGDLYRAFRQALAVPADAFGQAPRRGRNIDDSPVPEAGAAGRRVGIVRQQGEA